MKKITLSFFMFLLIIIFVGCGKSDEFNFILDKEKYTNILGVNIDVRVISENNLWYLETKGKKISEGYSSITPLSFLNYGWKYETGDFVNYYIATSADKNFILLDKSGNKIILKNEYDRFYCFVDDGFICITTSGKYVLIGFDGVEDDNKYDRIMPIKTVDEKRNIIASKINSSNIQTFYLLNSDGTTILSDCEEITTFPNNKYFLSIKKEDGYHIANTKGEYLDNEIYDNIEESDWIIKCSKTTTDTILTTYYSYFIDKYDKISLTINKTDDIEILYVNKNMIIYHDKGKENYVIKKSSNEEITYDYINVNYTNFKCYKDGNITFINSEGKELLTETEENLKDAEIEIDFNHILFHNLVKNTYYVANSEEQLTLTDDLSYDPTISQVKVYKTDVIGVYKVEVLKNNITQTAIFSPKITSASRLSQLEYYPNVSVLSGGVPFAVVKDLKINRFKTINLITGEESPFGMTFDPITFKTAHAICSDYGYSTFNNDPSIHGNTVSIIYGNYPDTLLDTYIFYNEITKNPKQKVFHVGDNAQIDYGYVYKYDYDKTKVYSYLKNDEDEYELKLLTTVNYTVDHHFDDNDETYFVFVNDQNKFGLCDKNGNLLLNPEYDVIYHSQNDNVIFKNNNLEGVLKLKGNGKYDLIADNIYDRISFRGDGNFFATKDGVQYYFNSNGEKYKDQIESYEDILYVVADPNNDNSYASVRAYKIDFGEYVKIYYNADELLD